MRDRVVEALGPEDPRVPEGPQHRPGQPCLACHDGHQPGVREFSVAGTVYMSPEDQAPAPGVRVELIDAEGTAYFATTNCSGNFFVDPADFAPVYPLWTSLIAGEQRVDMKSPIGRDGSCASCHAAEGDTDQVAQVYLHAFSGEKPPVGGCP